MTDSPLVEIARAARKAVDTAQEAKQIAERAVSIAPLAGPRGETGKRGLQGERGRPGKDGLDGRNGIDGKPGKDGEPGPAGKDGESFKWQGAFVNGRSYAKGDVVRFEGSAWVFKRGGSGSSPSAAGADLMVEKGEKGDSTKGGVAFINRQSEGTGGSGDGAAGDKGWSPVLAIVNDGARRVYQITDWTGGQGSKPATGGYIGTSGLVSTAAEAADVRGATGATGATGPQGPAGPNTVTSSTTTDINGLLKGNGATVAQAVAGTDYSAPGHTHSASEISNSTSAGRAILTATDAAAQRAALALKTGAQVAIHVGTTAPTSPAIGDLWVDTN